MAKPKPYPPAEPPRPQLIIHGAAPWRWLRIDRVTGGGPPGSRIWDPLQGGHTPGLASPHTVATTPTPTPWAQHECNMMIGHASPRSDTLRHLHCDC
jgi:hypothetical protein